MPRYAAIVTMWLASASLAEEPQSSVAITLEQPPASYVALGSLLVELEATTLPELVETLGIGVLRHNGRRSHDGGGDEVCFSYGGGVIRFTSNSEMGGSKRSVTDFLVEAMTTSPVDCSILPERFASVRVGGWLNIGDSRTTVERHFESTAGRGNARILYEFSGTTPGNCANIDLRAFDISTSLEITYRNYSVVRIKGSRLTTC